MQRTANSDIYDLGDDLRLAVVSSGDMNWQSPDGAWHRLDSGLVKGGDGRWRNRSGPHSTTVAEKTGKGDLVRVDGDGWRIGFSMAGVKPGVSPEIDGPIARFRGVREGVDLVEHVTSQGVKEVVVFDSVPKDGTDLVLDFPLSLDGVRPVEEEDGSVSFLDDADKIVATAPPAVAWDSSAVFSPGSRTSVQQTITRNGGAWVLQLAVPGTWLSADARTAPLFIDPAVIVGDTDGLPRESWDTFASSPDPDNTGYHNFYYDFAYVNFAGYDNYTASQQYTYENWDLDWLVGKQILSAEWRNYVHLTKGSAAKRGYYRLWPVSDSWGETNVSWNNKPNHRTDSVAGFATEGAQATRDLTDWVRNWVNGTWPRYGISIDSAGEDSGVRFGSENGDATKQAQLHIVYNTAPTPLEPAAPANGVSVSTDRPTLLGTGDLDPDGDTLEYKFQISDTDDPFVGEIYSSGWGPSSVHQPPGNWLKDGVTHSWAIATREVGKTTEYWSETAKFKVDRRLGNQPSAAFDDLGPVRVNLTNGNLITGGSSAALNSVGGPLELSWTYNSLAAPDGGADPLPSGWSLSAGDSLGLAYEKLVVDTDSVVLVDASGATHEYRQPSPGSTQAAWKPVDGDDAIISSNGSGYVVRGPDSLTYVFDADGRLQSATSGADWGNQAADLPDNGQVYDQRSDLSYEWTPRATGPAQLTKISDRQSTRALELSYSGYGPQSCDTSGGFNVPPTRKLCRIRYLEGSDDLNTPPDDRVLFETHLKYSGGYLAQTVNPGNEITEYVYTSGRLTHITSAAAKDAVANGQRTLSDLIRTVITYEPDPSGRVSSVTLPEPLPGAARPKHTYSYLYRWWDQDQYSDRYSVTTDVVVDGFTPRPSDYNRRVVMNSFGQVIEDFNTAGESTKTSWHPDDRMRWSQDAAGNRTTTVYDSLDRAVETWGPAPAGCFNEELPNGTCTTPAPPASYVAYDGASSFKNGTATGATPIHGLAAAYWKNEHLIGAPWSHEAPSGQINFNWTGAPATLGTHTDSWSASLTGDINAPSTGTYAFRVSADDGVRLYIDDIEIFDRFYECICGLSPEYHKDLTAGPHRIRLEYREATSTAYLALYWTAPGGNFELVPANNLAPRYDLASSAMDPDGKRTNTEYDVARGLLTATVADPVVAGIGQNLRSTTVYESPGISYGFGRPKYTRLPEGAASGYLPYDARVDTKLEYYGAYPAEGTLDPCVSSNPPFIYQAAMLDRKVEPDPDGTGGDGARETTYVYDRAGRIRATRTSENSIGNPNCIGYDDRGRVIWERDHELVTTNISYQGVHVTTRYPKPTPLGGIEACWSNAFAVGECSTREESDLLGRLYKYTDEQGTITTYHYDQAGRLTRTDRQLAGQPNLQLTAYTFDNAGRVTTLTEYASGVGRTTQFSYDAAGRLDKTTRPNQVQSDNDHNDPKGALSALSHKRGTTTLRSYGYTTSKAGRITTESSTGRNLSFEYDTTGRLSRTTENSTVRNYYFDRNSNRCSMGIVNCTDTSYEYDRADRITQSPFASAYEYDAYGNVIHTTGTSGNPSITYDYNGRNHATVINDGTTTVTERLSPSGRVLYRQVAPSVGGGAPTEKLTYGYDGPGDSPAYQVNHIPANPQTAAQPRSSATGHNAAPADTLVLPTPAGVMAGDVMIAAVAVRGVPTVTAHSDWTLIRSDSNGSSMKLLSYRRVATGAEQPDYTWNFSSSRAAAGTITAYTGVDATNPIDVHSGLAELNDTSSIVAPSVTTTGADQRLVALFATMKNTTITEPTGMVERGEDTAANGSEPPVTIATADAIQAAAAATGDKTATAGQADRNTGQLIALRNAQPGSGTAIQVRSTTTGQNAAPATTLVLTTPAGLAPNDVMIAAVAVRGVPTVTAHSDWTLIRSDSNGSSMKLLSYRRVATGAEQPDYTWNFSSSRAAAGTITAYTGVDTTNPIDVHSGQANTSDSALILAPSVTTTGADERIIGLFSIMKNTTITEPTGMQESGEATAANGSEPPVTIAAADNTQTTAGATGDKIATAGTADRNNGQLIALRASTSGGGSTPTGPSVTTYLTGPDGLLAIDTNGQASYPLPDGRGNIAGFTDAAGVFAANPTADEYGKSAGPAFGRLGWLGTAQRYGVNGTGVIRMGVRLYDSNLGRFLSVDSVPGGSCSAYDYVCSDPVNASDLQGTHLGRPAGSMRLVATIEIHRTPWKRCCVMPIVIPYFNPRTRTMWTSAFFVQRQTRTFDEIYEVEWIVSTQCPSGQTCFGKSRRYKTRGSVRVVEEWRRTVHANVAGGFPRGPDAYTGGSPFASRPISRRSGPMIPLAGPFI